MNLTQITPENKFGWGNRLADEVMYQGSTYHAELEYTRTNQTLSLPGKHALYLTGTASTADAINRSNPFVGKFPKNKSKFLVNDI